MLRFHFTAEDLALVRVTVLGPLAETQLSLWNLQGRDGKALHGGWRVRTGPLVTSGGPDTARLLSRPAGGLVDLFTLIGAAGCMDEGVERLSSTPDRRLRAEFAVLSAHGQVAGTVADRSDACRPAGRTKAGRRTAGLPLRRGGPVLGAHPPAPGRGSGPAREAHGGGRGGALLNSLRPMALWKAPVLEISGYRPPVPQLFASLRSDTVVMVYPALNNPVEAAGSWAPPPIHARSIPPYHPLRPRSSAVPGRSCCA